MTHKYTSRRNGHQNVMSSTTCSGTATQSCKDAEQQVLSETLNFIDSKIHVVQMVSEGWYWWKRGSEVMASAVGLYTAESGNFDGFSHGFFRRFFGRFFHRFFRPKANAFSQALCQPTITSASFQKGHYENISIQNIKH